MGSKVRELRLPLTAVFGGAALCSLLAFISMESGGIDLGVNLSLIGLLLGLLIPIGIEIRSRASRRRRILVLDYRSHHFGHAVARGVTRTLNADKRAWDVQYVSTGSASADGAVQYQVRQVQTAIIEDVDGIVLIPAADDDDLWFALAAAIKSSMFVVVVDTKPPNKVFRDVGIESPRFVSSRYNETGLLTADILEKWLAEEDNRECVLWIGPDNSWPGEERSRNIVYRLTRQSLIDRASLLPISSWAPEPTRCRETMRLVEECRGDVAVYCADDENAMALHLLTITEKPQLRSRMFVIGCNGTPDDWGDVPAIDQRAVDATIDIVAEEQGVQAAVMLIRERSRKLSASDRSTYIPPKVLLRASSGGRWLDTIFESSEDAEVEADDGDSEGWSATGKAAEWARWSRRSGDADHGLAISQQVTPPAGGDE